MTLKNTKIPAKTVHRLILYKKYLEQLKNEGSQFIYSHNLADVAMRTSAQVRRDIMLLGFEGSPAHGYNIKELHARIVEFINNPDAHKVIIVGLGNLGKAIIDYCNGRHSHLGIVGAFDNDESKVGSEFHGCKCYHIDDVEKYIKKHKIKIAILAVPAKSAQSIATHLVISGIRGLLNFTQTRLVLMKGVHIEYLDMMLSLEKTSYFLKKQ